MSIEPFFKIKPNNFYNYSLPDELNINNKSFLLFGGYPVNITSNGNKMTVSSDSYFGQELFRSLISKTGGNLGEEEDCLRDQDNYLSIYLYEQSLIKTSNILNFKILDILSSKNIPFEDFKQKGKHKNIKKEYRKIINEYNYILIQIQNYKVLRRILKQNECIMDNLYNIKDGLRNILNLEKIFLDNSEKVEKYKLIYKTNIYYINYIYLKLIENNNNISINTINFKNNILKVIDNWNKNKILIINMIISYLEGGHANHLILFKNNNKKYALRIDPNNIISNLIILIKNNIMLLDGETSLEIKINDSNNKNNYTEIYKQITIEDLNIFSEKYKLLLKNKSKDIIDLNETLKKNYQDITINNFLTEKLKKRDITFLNIFPNHGIQTNIELRLSKIKLFSEKYYDFKGFCSIFSYYITNEFVKQYDNNINYSEKDLEERILEIYNNIYDKVSEDIKNIDVSKDKYVEYQLKDLEDKEKIKKLMWISNISKELTQFRNQIVPFGVSDNSLLYLFLNRYYNDSDNKESPKEESPKKESPKKESPKEESPKKESPKKESSKKESPKINPEPPIFI